MMLTRVGDRAPSWIVLPLFLMVVLLGGTGFLGGDRMLDVEKTLSHLNSPSEKTVKRELGYLIFYKNVDDVLAHQEKLQPVLVGLLSHRDIFIRVASAEILWRVFDDDQGGIEIVNALTGKDREAELYALFTIFRLGERPVDLLLRENVRDGELGRTSLALDKYRMKKMTEEALKYLEYPDTQLRYDNFTYIHGESTVFPTNEAARRIRGIILRIVQKEKKDRNKHEDSIWAAEKWLLGDDTDLQSKALDLAKEGLHRWRKALKIASIMEIAEIIGSRELFPDPKYDTLREQMRKDAERALRDLREKSRDKEILEKIDYALDIVVNNKVFSGLTYGAKEIAWDKGSIRPLYGKSLQIWIMRDRDW